MTEFGSGHVGGGGVEGERDLPLWLCRHPDGGWLIRVKAVPGASRDEIVGPLGDRLKVRIAAAPEGGKANKAICKLIAKRLGVAPNLVEVAAGTTNPEKTVYVNAEVTREEMARLAT